MISAEDARVEANRILNQDLEDTIKNINDKVVKSIVEGQLDITLDYQDLDFKHKLYLEQYLKSRKYKFYNTDCRVIITW